MKRFLTRASVAGLSAALVAGVAIVAAPAASAAPIGTLDFGSLNNQNQTFNVTTNGACPTTPTLATNFVIRVSGPGITGTPNINGNTAGSTVSGGINQANGFVASVNLTLAGFATAQAQPGGYLGAGTYTFELVCRTAAQSASLGEFVGQITVSGSGATSVVTPVLPASSTTTVLSPATQNVGLGGNASVTATVTNSGAAGNGAPTGTVQFKKNGTNVGSPVALTGATATTATAVGSIPATAVGTDTITAAYVPSGNFNASSDTTGVSVVVGKASTTTTVSLNNPTPDADTNIVLSAQVAKVVAGVPGTPGGTVTFSVSPSVGSLAPVTLSNGTASLVLGKIPAGSYTISASYSGDASFDVSTGNYANNPVVVTVPNKPYQVATEYVRTVVEDGALTISVNGFNVASPTDRTNLSTGNKAYGIVNGTLPLSGPIDPATGRPANAATGFGAYGTYGNGANVFGSNAGTVASNVVYLPNALLNAAGTFIETSGNIIPVRVTDTRAGDLGYSVTGKISDLDNIDGVTTPATDRIKAQNVGWTPAFISASRPGVNTSLGGGITNGTTVAADGTVAGNVSTSPTDAAGLANAKTLFSVAKDKSNGTIVYGALLSIKAPTATKPGVFEGVLTLTAVA